MILKRPMMYDKTKNKSKSNKKIQKENDKTRTKKKDNSFASHSCI